ncbi:MAG TPA: YciI family protein [Mucilaginibacter sp.]|jgi:hypothetical protein
MKEFVMLYKSDELPEVQLNDDGSLVVSKEWQTWIGELVAQNQLVSPGKRLGNDGLLVKPGNVITNGPYAEIKEMIGGLSVIRVGSMDEATEIAKGCPILDYGGSVEIREVIPMNN